MREQLCRVESLLQNNGHSDAEMVGPAPSSAHRLEPEKTA